MRPLIYAVVAWIASLMLVGLIGPLLFPNTDPRVIGRIWGPLSVVVVGLPVYVLAYRKTRSK